MKKVYFYLLCASTIQLAFTSLAHAQTTTLTLKVPPAAVVVDGGSTEWGDTLSFYNAEKKVRYTIANDKTKLYLVVKTNDPMQESNILGAGLTFTIDTKGKKRSSFLTTFPSNGENAVSSGVKIGEQPIQAKATYASMTALKKINVSGFREINEDYIGTTNSYGIQVAVGYDDKGYLTYEEAIPLDLFHPGDLVKTEWSFNIKLNAVEKSAPAAAPDASSFASSGGSKGGGGGKGGGSRVTPDATASLRVDRITKPIDFWGKFILAPVQ